jgi:hypothetical protein
MIFYKTIYLSQICNEYNFQKYFVQYIMGNQNYCSWKHKVVDPYGEKQSFKISTTTHKTYYEKTT